jgi:hypothetical protein
LLNLTGDRAGKETSQVAHQVITALRAQVEQVKSQVK